MGELNPEQFRASLAERLSSLSIPFDDAGLDRLLTHARLLDEWAGRMNLVGLKDRARWVDELYADSARLLPNLAAVKGPAVDIGSGAGFPGLVGAALDPARRWTLLDSNGKRHSFLIAAIDAMRAANASAMLIRAEEFGRDPTRRGRAGAAVFKALGRWSAGLELAMPLVKVGGLAAFFAGKDPPEPAALERVSRKLGGGAIRVEQYRLPGAEHPRHIVVVEKAAPTPAHYPRKVGEPERRPLDELI